MDKEVKKHNQKSILLLYNVSTYILTTIAYNRFYNKKILTYPCNLFMFLVRFSYVIKRIAIFYF